MNCPNCGCTTISDNICDKCGVDVVLYKKASGMSCVYYNEGYTDIKANNLSKAAECLKKSISFNKNNIKARNLLGLVYYRLGLIGDAIKHWVISASILKENNPASEYLSKIQKNNNSLEKYSDSIKMHNQALSYLKQKSEDMAVIQLKKSLELNPDFISSLNLLALCYLMQKDKTKALSCVEKVLSIDISNSTALNYYKEIKPTKQKVEVRQESAYKPRSYKRQESIYTNKERKSLAHTFHVAEIMSFLVGGACVAGIFYILVMPSQLQAKDVIISGVRDEMRAAEQLHNKEIASWEDKDKSKDREISALNNQNELLSEQIAKQERIIKVNNAAEQSRSGNLEDTADILYHLDITGLPIDTVELYERLVTDTYPKVSSNLYNSAVSLYNKKDYDAAEQQLMKTLIYMPENASYASGVLYYLGGVNEAKQQKEAAIKYYEELVEKYPRSSFINNTKKRLQALQ